MNSEHPNPYTAEEMASNLFQTAPVTIVLNPETDDAAAFFDQHDDVNWSEAPVYGNEFLTVGYVRRDVYEMLAARVAELKQQLENCIVDLAELDASRFGGAP